MALARSRHSSPSSTTPQPSSTPRRESKRHHRRVFFEPLEDRRVLTGEPYFDWAVRAGSLEQDVADAGQSIATDAQGNVYVAGNFRGTVDFDPGPGVVNLISPVSGAGKFVAKYSGAGNLIWAQQLGGTSVAQNVCIAVDAAQNVYATGAFEGTGDFDPGPGVVNLTSIGNADIFISKLDSNGSLVWAQRMGANLPDLPAGIVVDGAGNTFIAGTVDATNPQHGQDVVVAKLNSSGVFTWVSRMSGPIDESASGIALDAAGNVYTTGTFAGTVDFDPGAGVQNLVSIGPFGGSADIFVSKLNSAGSFVWAKQMGGTSNDTGGGIAVDAAGNVWTSGTFLSTADFDPGPGTTNLTSAGQTDIYLVKLSSAGNLISASQLGGSGSDSGSSLAVDGTGNVYATGTFRGTADFDPGAGIASLTSVGAVDVFIAKFDSSGGLGWVQQVGDLGGGIAVDGNGNVFVTGTFFATVDFDPGPGVSNLTDGTNGDIFILKLSSTAPPPKAIDFSGTPLYETAEFGTVVGTLSTTDINPLATHTYSLVDGPGDEGNDSFAIVGNALTTAAVFNYNTQAVYSVRVRTTNQFGLSFERQLTITILPGFGWAMRAGSSALDYGTAVAADNAGNSYVTGVYIGTVDFDPSPAVVNLTGGPSGAVFVAKYDSFGGLVWAKKFAGSVNDAFSYGDSRGIEVDSSGNVYTTGTLRGTMDFDPGSGTRNLTAVDGTTAFVSKLDTNGNFAWANTLGSGSHGNGIALDTLGNVYTVGEFTGGDFDPGAGTTFNMSGGTAGDVFVSKLTTNGVFAWAKQFKGSVNSVDIGNDIAVDSSGNVYTTGRFSGANTDFDPGPGVFALSPTNNYDGFISKLDMTGAFAWAKKFGGTGTDEGVGLATDSIGNVYLNGSGLFNLGSTPTSGQFLAKLDGTGTPVWTSSSSGTTDFAIDANGGIYLTGSSTGSSGAADVFVRKITSDGQFLWTKTFGGAGDDFGFGVAVDGAGSILTTGYFTSTNADFNPGPGQYLLSGEVNGDIFLSKLRYVVDSDGVTDAVEDGAANGGDGNGDGTLDSEQANVTSLPSTGTNAPYVTLASPVGTTLAAVAAIPVTAVPVAAPGDVGFPLGVLAFTIDHLVGNESELELFLPPGVTANTYYKFGPEPQDDPATPGLNEATEAHWYEFLYDENLSSSDPNYHTGAQFVGGNKIVLHFVDGKRGDDDLQANGKIVDDGGPGNREVIVPLQVTSFQVNDGNAQRSMVTKLMVNFNRPVSSLATGDFELLKQNGLNGPYAASGVSLNWALAANGLSATITFNTGLPYQSLDDGRYKLAIRVEDLDQQTVDFHRLFGDTDNNGVVDNGDLTTFRLAMGKTSASPNYPWWYDFNNDGRIDSVDFNQARLRTGKRV